MQIEIKSLPGLERELHVKIPAATIENKIKEKINKIAPKVKMDGFRPGKVPFTVLYKKHSPKIREDVIERLPYETVTDILKQEGLKTAIYPEIEIVSADPGEQLVYTATFELSPEIDLSLLPEIEAEKIVAEVTDEDVAREIENMRKRNADWQEVSDPSYKAKEGDQVIVDLNVAPGADSKDFPPESQENFVVVLGDDYVWKEFVRQFYGVSRDEEKRFTLPLQEDSEKIGDVTIKVRKISNPVLPELNDEFAKRMKVEGGVDDLKRELKEFMGKNLQETLEKHLKEAFANKVYEKYQIELPKGLVEKELDKLEEKHKEQFAKKAAKFSREDHLEDARRQACMSLILSAIIEEQQLEAKEEEVNEKIKEIISKNQNDLQGIIKKYIGDLKGMLSLKREVLEDKGFVHLKATVRLIEKPKSYADIMTSS